MGSAIDIINISGTDIYSKLLKKVIVKHILVYSYLIVQTKDLTHLLRRARVAFYRWARTQKKALSESGVREQVKR